MSTSLRQLPGRYPGDPFAPVELADEDPQDLGDRLSAIPLTAAQRGELEDLWRGRARKADVEEAEEAERRAEADRRLALEALPSRLPEPGPAGLDPSVVAVALAEVYAAAPHLARKLLWAAAVAEPSAAISALRACPDIAKTLGLDVDDNPMLVQVLHLFGPEKPGQLSQLAAVSPSCLALITASEIGRRALDSDAGPVSTSDEGSRVRKSGLKELR